MSSAIIAHNPARAGGLRLIAMAIVLAAIIGASATLPPMMALGATLALVAFVSVFWIEAGCIVYFVGLHFILFVKRVAYGQPVGLLLDGFFILLVTILLLRLSRADDTERLRWRHPLIAMALIYVGYQFVNAFNPNSFGWVFSFYAVRQALFPDLGVFMLGVLLISTHHRLKQFMTIWVALAAFVGLYAIKQHFFGFFWRERVWMYSAEGQVWTTGEGRLRVFSTMLPDTTGITMAFALTLGFALLLAPIRARFKLLLVVLMPVFGAALLYTGTRSAYAAALVGIAIVVVFMGRWWLYVLTPIVLVMAATVITSSSNYWASRFTSVFSPDQDASYQVRQDIIGRYLQPALDRPFGFGTSTTSYAGFAKDHVQSLQANGMLLEDGMRIPTDNNYFLVLVEHGVVGILLLFLVLGVALFYSARFAFTVRDPFLRAAGVGLFGCCVGVVVASVSNNYLNFWGTWIVLALICSVDQLARAEKSLAVQFRPVLVPATAPSALRPLPERAGGRIAWPELRLPPVRPALPALVAATVYGPPAPTRTGPPRVKVLIPRRPRGAPIPLPVLRDLPNRRIRRRWEALAPWMRGFSRQLRTQTGGRTYARKMG